MALEEPSVIQGVKVDKTESKSTSSDFDVKELLGYLWRKKLWILLSLAVCLGCAYYTYRQKPHIYKSEAQVMFLLGDERGAAGAGMQSLGDVMGPMNVNLSNEIEMIKSPALMEDVVTKLGLEVSYTTPRSGYNENMYGYSPVNVFFYDVPADSSASFIVKRIDDKTVLVYDFVRNGRAISGPGLRVPLNCIVESPVGRLAMTSTPNYAYFPDVVNVTKRTLFSVASTLAASVYTTFTMGENTVVTLGMENANQQLATDVVRTLIESYNEMWMEENQRSANQTSNFIRERLVSLEAELSGIDRSMASKKKEIGGGGEFSDIYTPKGEERIDAAYDLTTNLAIAENARGRIQSSLASGMPVSASSGNGAVDGLVQTYNETLMKAKKAAEGGAGDNNPVLKEYNSQLEQLRSGINAGLNSMISDYRLQVNRVQSLGNIYKGRGNVIPDVQADMLPVERQQKVKETIYLYLLQKREENELNKMIASNNTRIIQPARAMGVVGPFMIKFLSVGLLIGFVLPIVLFVLLFKLDTKVKSRADLKGLSAPFLGEMPLTEKYKKRSRIPLNIFRRKNRNIDDEEIDIVVKERSRSYINEAFRMVRTNLDFMTSSHSNSQVLLVTSIEPRSGKSFVSLNLAASLAINKKRVLVIDADLRRASLKKFGAGMAQGLSACLSGKVDDPMSLVVRERRRGLVDLLNVGAVPPNPVELLLSDNFGKLIQYFRERYDYVLLDCPPYGLVADTSIIASHVDTSIFVIRAGFFRKNAIAGVEQIYKSGKLPRMTVLFNGVEPGKSYYGTRYGYKSEYGYYVSDSEDDSDSDGENTDENTQA